MKRLSTALVAGLLTVLGSIPAVAASPWETLQLKALIVTVASDGSCEITARVLWTEVKSGRPLDVTIDLAEPGGIPAEGGATVTVPAREGKAAAVVDNPDGLTSFEVSATVSGGNFELTMGPVEADCPGSSI